MPKHRPHDINVQDIPADTDVSTFADTLIERGRAAIEDVPALADRAREGLAVAQNQVNGLSDIGVVAAAGFALGVTTGLFLAGAPRLILAASAVPIALTMASTLRRGMRPASLAR